MSTAGKVLSVLVLLSVLVWSIMAAGVAELNYNGNKELRTLVEQIAKLEDDVHQNQEQFIALRNQTTHAQESFSRQVATLQAKQNNVEKARSQIFETLSGLKYQLEVVQATIASAQTTFENRSTEARDEEKALADARALVKSYDTQNTELLARLQSLRDQFKSTYRSNVELVGTRK